MDTFKSGLNRRDFIKTSAGVGLIIGTGTYGSLLASGRSSERTVRIGFIGVGSRGTGMLKVALTLEGVEIPVVCDDEGIVWLVGHEIADRAKIDTSTRKVLKINVTRRPKC